MPFSSCVPLPSSSITLLSDMPMKTLVICLLCSTILAVQDISFCQSSANCSGSLLRPSSQAENSPPQEPTSLLARIFDNLNGSYQDIPPYKKNKVECALHINKVGDVKEKFQSFTLDVYLDVTWTDYRLNSTASFTDLTLPDKYLQKIWIPDVGFANALTGRVHKVTDNHLYVTIRPGGKMQLTTWIAVELSCPMDFTYYPMDTQLCELQLQSWRYSEEDVLLSWQETRLNIAETEIIEIAEYYLHIAKEVRGNNSRCKVTYDSTGQGTFSCLELNFALRRRLRFHALDIYLPSTLIVLVSFLALIIDHNIVPARITIGSLSMTAMTNIAKSYKQKAPPIFYTNAADVWIWGCQALVFAVFLEFGVVNYFNRWTLPQKPKEGSTLCVRRTPTAKEVDKIARIVFPSAFVLLAVIYWIYWLSNSEYSQSLADAIHELVVDSSAKDGIKIPG